MDPKDISNALRNLATREILQEVPGDVERYVFKVGLVALWIERYKSLPRVMEDLASPTSAGKGIASGDGISPADASEPQGRPA
jgi:hypothetical protein